MSTRTHGNVIEKEGPYSSREVKRNLPDIGGLQHGKQTVHINDNEQKG